MNVGLNGAPYYAEWAQKTRNLVEVGSAQSFFEYFKISTYRYIFKVIFIVSSLCFHSQLMLCGWTRWRNEWEREYLPLQFGTFHFHLHALHQQLQFSEQFSAVYWRVASVQETWSLSSSPTRLCVLGILRLCRWWERNSFQLSFSLTDTSPLADLPSHSPACLSDVPQILSSAGKWNGLLLVWFLLIIMEKLLHILKR